VRTSAITIINLEFGQPNIIHRPFAAQSAQQRECGGAAPLTLRLPTLRCSPLSWVRQNYFHLLDFSSARLAESGFWRVDGRADDCPLNGLVAQHLLQ